MSERSPFGFTLVEVLVALGIVAIALGAGLQATAALTRNAQRQTDVLLGQMCAENELVEIRLTKQMPGVGDTQVDCEQAGHRYRRAVGGAAHPQHQFPAGGCPGAGRRDADPERVDRGGALLMLRRRPAGGFTLIELLVAISLMALMSAPAWRGLDGTDTGPDPAAPAGRRCAGAAGGAGAVGRRSGRLGAAAQRQQSGAGTDEPCVCCGVTRSALPTACVWWPGRAAAQVPRRLAAPGSHPRSAAMALCKPPGKRRRCGRRTRALRTNAGRLTLVPLADWQIFFYRGDAWTNPLSSAGAARDDKAGRPELPDGVRLVLGLSAGQTISGSLTRDWVRPGLGGGK